MSSGRDGQPLYVSTLFGVKLTSRTPSSPLYISSGRVGQANYRWSPKSFFVLDVTGNLSMSLLSLGTAHQPNTPPPPYISSGRVGQANCRWSPKSFFVLEVPGNLSRSLFSSSTPPRQNTPPPSIFHLGEWDKSSMSQFPS